MQIGWTQKLLGEQGILKVVLRDDSGGIVEDGPLAFMKVKLAVLRSDLTSDGLASDGLNQYILHPRSGRRPLLAGKSELCLFKGVAYIDDVEITDNSCWIRSNKFRLGATVEKSLYPGVTVRGAISEAFTVKDRSLAYSKKENPALDDEVWRLKGISKGGKLHLKLSSIGILSVGDLLQYHNKEGKLPLTEILHVSHSKINKLIQQASRASYIKKTDIFISRVQDEMFCPFYKTDSSTLVQEYENVFDIVTGTCIIEKSECDILTTLGENDEMCRQPQNPDELCVQSQKLLNVFSPNISQECLDCLVVYCSLFPKDYVIDGDTLIQLWMAEDLIKEEPMEDIAAAYLKALCENKKCISLLSEDCGTCKIWYKINGFELAEQELQRSKINPVRVISEYARAKAEHVHVILQRLFSKDLKVLASFTNMRSLLLLQNHKANVERIPSDFFISLRDLRALDLSRMKVSEIPSSIGNAKSLRYLDLSETLIKKLPETIEFLENLQTMKLINCPSLVSLPKCMKRLTRLRHLDFGNHHRIHSMPDGMGSLLKLRTLSEFIVGGEGSGIGELEKMNHLNGKLRLSRLENVASFNEALKARLNDKQQLKSLELRWTDKDTRQESINIIDDVADYLQPHKNLHDLRILFYGGSKFPCWISSHFFVKLTKITLFKCANCLCLPSLGQLPSLESLILIELSSVRFIAGRFLRDEALATAATTSTVAFPKLQQLQIKSMLNLLCWISVKNGDFPRLRKLSIKDCPKLAAVCRIGSMASLEHLELNKCTKLAVFRKVEWLTSLKTLIIENCPSFILCSSLDGKDDWVKIQHSPNSLIYQRKEEDEQGEILDPTKQRGSSSMASSDMLEFPSQ
ncbi:putative disease resistance protein At3g14460 isoform X2 [Amaranthus tricolor]|uniref:putative disease resistance protein At3g14460 isoform X2 n=1 Tax=Amaranthus tricolor TaxID=29722 RepID=UPI0025851D9E|nr:putative disease resistance protein At3g14460 isoform X2 [Amaranthus tricolor]